MEAPPIQAGMVLAGHQLIARIGAGGMGEVWRASNVTLDGLVRAVKVIHPRFAENPEFQERFLWEAKLLYAVDHPNVLRFLDIGSQDGRLYIVMELLDGQPMDSLLKEKGPQAAALVAQVGAHTLAGLAAAHARTIIHRDIKPANLFLQKTGVVKVLDFGIAKALGGDLTATRLQTAELIGTIPYMAPELLDEVPASPASDVYATGITLFELLTGALPFTAPANSPPTAATIAILSQASRKPFPDLRKLRPDVPQAMVEAIEQAVSKRPETRPTAAELAARLSEFKPRLPAPEPAGLPSPSATVEPTRVSPPRPWRRRLRIAIPNKLGIDWGGILVAVRADRGRRVRGPGRGSDPVFSSERPAVSTRSIPRSGPEQVRASATHAFPTNYGGEDVGFRCVRSSEP